MMIETSFMESGQFHQMMITKKPLDFVVLPPFQRGVPIVRGTGDTGSQGTSCDPQCQNISLTPTRFAPPDKF